MHRFLWSFLSMSTTAWLLLPRKRIAACLACLDSFCLRAAFADLGTLLDLCWTCGQTWGLIRFRLLTLGSFCAQVGSPWDMVSLRFLPMLVVCQWLFLCWRSEVCLANGDGNSWYSAGLIGKTALLECRFPVVLRPCVDGLFRGF